MDSSNLNREYSRRLLTHVAQLLEASQRCNGGFNCLAARYAGNAAVLLNFNELSARFLRLLVSVTPEQYWTGAITNLDRSRVPEHGRTLSGLPELDHEHPFFTEDYPAMVISKFAEEHLFLCLRRDYEQAFAHARSELAIEEVALTQAIIGDTEMAIASTSRLKEKHRRDNVLFVVTIELFRRNKVTEAQTIRRQLPDGIFDEWGASQMAIGIANRVPWQIYPYPDY